MKKWLMRMAAVAAIGAAGIGMAACGGDDDEKPNSSPTAGATATASAGASEEEQAVQDAVSAMFAAWNAKDVDDLVGAFTEEGLVAVFGEEGQTADDVAAELPLYIGSEEITVKDFTETTVDESDAATDVQFATGLSVRKSKFDLLDEGGVWKINAEEMLSPDVPEGVTLVHVDLNEFAFGVDTNEITDGSVAFEASNVGEQEHELAVVSIPEDAVLDDILAQFLASEDGEVPGVVFIGQTSVAPDETSNLVFSGPLESGRYAMVCLFPDETQGEDGPTHAEQGMIKDFTIE